MLQNRLANLGTRSYVQVDTSVSHGDGDRKTMWICPRFWNGSESAQDLPRGWDQIAKFCAQDDYKAYVTAGECVSKGRTTMQHVRPTRCARRL